MVNAVSHSTDDGSRAGVGDERAQRKSTDADESRHKDAR